ncbi:MAG: hypothetical protein IKL90_00995 [Alphaproteobacteria bacterium]|nr:hypothetical protein [Alphaproteobacteria bacterium]
MAVGVRNNNPGCIRSGKGYAKYATLEEGYIALNSLLYRRYDRMTLKEMFQIYAPSSDGSNNPSLYARNVLTYLQNQGYEIDFNTRLDFSDPDFRAAVTMAISIQENGRVLGGEELALRASRNYNPQTDTGKRYSQTEARRAQYSNINMQRKTGSPIQNTTSMGNKTPGIVNFIQMAASGQQYSLTDILKMIGSNITETPDSLTYQDHNSRIG